VLGGHTHRSGTADAAGFTSDSQTYQLGGQKEIAPNWYLGGSFSYEKSRHRARDVALRADGDAYNIGLVLKRQAGPWLFAGSVTAGHGKHHTRRSIHLSDSPFYATSEYRSKHATMGLRTSYVYAQPHWYVKPIVDLTATYHRVPAHSEGGAGPLNLHYDKADQTSL